jgi:DnaJ-class molecular chaperone
MPRDYYIVLGIERGADFNQIKRAYRKAIKRYHPDTIGRGTDTNKFLEAREAYEVLSDIDSRRAYDEGLKQEGAPIRIRKTGDIIRRRTSAWEEFRRTPSILDVFFEGIVPGIHRGSTGRRAITTQDLYVEVVLSPFEARHGGVFPITVPVKEACPDCGQSGWFDGFYCPTCVGYGAITSYRDFNLAIPPDIRNGTTAEVPLDDLGLRGARLLVAVNVSDHGRM